jgi:hypothetical protein
MMLVLANLVTKATRKHDPLLWSIDLGSLVLDHWPFITCARRNDPITAVQVACSSPGIFQRAGSHMAAPNQRLQLGSWLADMKRRPLNLANGVSFAVAR